MNDNMNQRNKVWNCSVIVALCVLALVWFLLFSDYSKTGSTTINDMISFAAIGFFFIISIFACKGLNRMTCVHNDFRKAIHLLHNWENAEQNQNRYTELEACFTDKVVLKSFRNFRTECDSLRQRMPNGCECDIADYINESEFEDYLGIEVLNQYPGLYTGIGMLGTFVGLSLGLTNFNFLGSSAEIARNIESLMSCIQLAFVTSIMGLFLSFVFNAQYRRLSRNTLDGLKSFVSEYHRQTDNANHNSINRIIENQSGQTNAIRTLSDDIAVSVSDLLSTQMKHMENTYLEACNRLEESQAKGMELLVDKFTEKLLGTLTSGIEHLGEAIEETCTYQQRATEGIKENVEKICSLTDKTVEIQRISQDTVVKLKEYTDSLDENMNKMMEQVRENNKSMISASAIFEKMSDLAKQVVVATKDLMDSAGDMTEAVNEMEESYREHIEKLAEVSESMTAGFDKQKNDFCEEAERQRAELERWGSDTAQQLSESVDAYSTATDGLKLSVSEHVEQAVSQITDSNNMISKELGTVLDDCTRRIQESSERVCDAVAQMEKRTDNLKQIVENIPENVSEGVAAKTNHVMQELENLRKVLIDLGDCQSDVEEKTTNQSLEAKDDKEADQ